MKANIRKKMIKFFSMFVRCIKQTLRHGQTTSDKCGCSGSLEVREVNFHIYDFLTGLISFEFLGFNCFSTKIILYWFKNSAHKLDALPSLLPCCALLIVSDALSINLTALTLNHLKIFFRTS